MPRIRTVKPELWSDEDLSSVSEPTVLLAIALLNFADDEGYFNANPMLIKAFAFPLREPSRTIPVMLQELSDIGYLELFSAIGGKRFGHICSFSEHQVVQKKKPSKIKDLPKVQDEYDSRIVPVHGGREGKGKEQGTGKHIGRIAKTGTAERFEEFWTAYPKKAKKKESLKIWKARQLDNKADTLIADVENRKANDGRWLEGFVPDPTTYLRNDRWDDELEPRRAPKVNGAHDLDGYRDMHEKFMREEAESTQPAEAAF